MSLTDTYRGNAFVFVAQFYSVIGFGKNLKMAFNQAKAALMLEAISEFLWRMLWLKQSMEILRE